MRDADAARGRTGQFIRPRFMVWEQVPGAFSSNKGEDFRVVLEEIIRIAEPDAPDVPLPRKWPMADCWMGNGWSIAYRVLDGELWGVPQRRRRIALVADFAGQSAPEILFVRNSVCWDSSQVRPSWEKTSPGTGSSTGKAIYCLATQQGGAELRCDDKAPTLTAAAGTSGNNQPVIYYTGGVVRRLTPLECERLQGFPDGWTDIGPWTDSAGKLHKESSDSARYKALGNSIALPPWKWVLKRLCACYERDATMGSLFDGIGGFPLIWERLNGPRSCLWTSEIEDFPIAVTKYHFIE